MKSEISLRTLLAAWILTLPGCTVLRELPREHYATREERRNVRVETVEGLRYEFDQVKFGADTLVGYRLRDNDSRFEEYDTLALPLDRVSRLSTRRVDWYKTGLIGGTALAAVVAAALTQIAKSDDAVTGGGPKPPPTSPSF